MSELWKKVVNELDEIGKASGCHRKPERSFFLRGHQFPVCARCTGVGFGQLTAVLLLLRRKVISFPISVGMLAIMGADWGIQEVGIHESTNPRRLITGFLGGLGLFSIYITVAKRIFSLIRERIR